MATNAASARISSDKGERSTIPALADANAEWPVAVEASPCDDNNTKPIRFFFEQN